MRDRLLTVKEVAERLRVNPHSVYEWVWAGHLPHRRLGPTGRVVRVSESDLARYLETTAQGRDR